MLKQQQQQTKHTKQQQPLAKHMYMPIEASSCIFAKYFLQIYLLD